MGLVDEALRRDIEAPSADAAPFTAWRGLTTPLAAVFGLLVWLRGYLYDSKLLRQATLPGVTISVGNIVTGGTGKSPVTASLAARLHEEGRAVAILTRGYGSGLASDDSLALLAGEVVMRPRGAARIPDEARMQSVRLPEVAVIAGADRARAARRFLMECGDIPVPAYWVLDDGFQHRRITRDLDVVLLDAAAPFRNGRLLPRGGLRERPNALRRAGFVVFTRAGEGAPQGDELARVRRFFAGPIALARFVPSTLGTCVKTGVSFDAGLHAPVFALAGIARPAEFFAGLVRQGLPLGGQLAAADHEAFSKELLLARLGSARSIVTTAKDYWRDPTFFADIPVPVFVQELEVVWEGEDLGASVLTLLDQRDR